MILGLDVSISSTGWCMVNKEQGIIKYGKITTKPKDFENEDLRIIYICDRVVDIIKNHNITDVAIEDQFTSRNSKTILLLRKLIGALMYAIRKEGLEIDYIYPTSIRKLIMNNGRAKKEEVAAYIQTNHINIGEYSDKANKNKTSDIYDAIAVALAYWNKHYKNK